ncbi:MAG: PD-(D/E)XK nuclease family protein [Candidatus Niyogibacteria bacterium]|nr:PD-(D/E)XK nuclease family protein [Candidatus Niyogibacteria bacterium]
MRISYSSLEQFLRCPYLFKYIVLDKNKLPKTKEAALGTSVHEALNFQFKKSPLFPTLDEVINFYNKRWEERIAKVEFKDDYEKDAMHQNGILMLSRFYKKNPAWNFTILGLEMRFEAPFIDPETNETHTLSGIIDRIDKLDDNTYEIIDYKTARRMPAQDHADKNLQLAIYHLGALARWPHLRDKKIRLTLQFLQHGETLVTSRTSEDLEETKRRILVMIHTIEEHIKNNDWPAKSSPLCAMHPYNKICPMWSYLYQKKDISVDIDEKAAKDALSEYIGIKSAHAASNERMMELQAILLGFMKNKGFSRLFGNEGYVTRNLREQDIYDVEKAKSALDAIGKWEEILTADHKKLEKILPSLPSQTQIRLHEEAFLRKKTTESLLMRRKKIDPEDLE